jgi:hypothetical protein
MTGKERAKYNTKGIFTITQLSYGYRLRRRKRTKTDAEGCAESARCSTAGDRNDHNLKALAIKKHQIHVVGAPSLSLAEETAIAQIARDWVPPLTDDPPGT